MELQEVIGTGSSSEKAQKNACLLTRRSTEVSRLLTKLQSDIKLVTIRTQAMVAVCAK